MKKKKAFWVTTGLLVAVLLAAGVAYAALRDKLPQNQIQEQTEGSGGEDVSQTEAPDFTMLDQEGREVRLSDFKGKPIVLNFWASWCGPCKSEMPDLQRMYDRKKDEVVFLLVNLTDGSRETVKTAQDYVNSQFFTFPIYFDTRGEGSAKYGVYAVPQTYFIDKDGHLQAYWQGPADLDILEQGISMIQSA